MINIKNIENTSVYVTNIKISEKLLILHKYISGFNTE